MSSQEAEQWKVGGWVRVLKDLAVYMHEWSVIGYIPKGSIGRVIGVFETEEHILIQFFCPKQDKNGNWDNHVESVPAYFTGSHRVDGKNRTSQLKKIVTPKKAGLPPTTMLFEH